MAFCSSWSRSGSIRNAQVTAHYATLASCQTSWFTSFYNVRTSRYTPVKLFIASPKVLTMRLDPQSKRQNGSSERSDNDNSSNNNKGDDDDDDETDTVISRRVYLLGTLASTVITGTATYRFFIGDDEETRLRYQLSRRFPRIFAPAEEPNTRLPTSLDTDFATAYFNSVGEIAISLKLASSLNELKRDEQYVRSRARALFFYDGGPANSRPTFSNPDWLNFCLYARLHTLAQKTSPKTRMQFAERLAERTFPYLESSARGARVQDTDAWLQGMSEILHRLCAVGWISDFRIEPFDSLAWTEDRRASLTVYAISPVVMQTAQLLAEEGFEEFSPKVSFWLVRYLRSCGICTSWEDFYLDDVYKPDPAFYKPTQLATQFDLSF